MNSENNNVLTGTIVKLIGGIYFVDVSDTVYECTARGVFRNKGISLYCGDTAVIQKTADGKAVITEIKPRRNAIIRPPLANLDNLVFVSSTCEPAPNLLLLDKFIAVAQYKGINPVVVFTKTDKQPADELCDIYTKSGIEVYAISSGDVASAQQLRQRFVKELSAFTGNTGVGKTTLLNNMFPELNEKTAQISKKLGRGKHTTRHVSLYKLQEGGYVADTPGFSSFETNQYDIILKDELAGCFKEFEQYLGKCRYVNCSHTKENGCAVLEALQKGDICASRHQSYVEMFNEAKNIPEWQYKSIKNKR